ncbi:MAG: ABC transporter ATP-binding protein, partial [Moorea sp. SIO3E2]|nr:ABC transporter ATP-binding protein [Moorena sp. SIO3E2]
MGAGKTLKTKIQQTLRLLPALRLVWQSSPFWTGARVGLLLVQGILPLLSIYLTKLIIDTVTDGLNTADKQEVFRDVLLFLILAGTVTLVTTLLNSLGEVVSHSLRMSSIDYFT